MRVGLGQRAGGRAVVGPDELIDARDDSGACAAGDIGLFPFDVLGRGEQLGQVALELVGHCDRRALVRRHAFDGDGKPRKRDLPESRRLKARNEASTALSQPFGAPEASCSWSSSIGRSNRCLDNSFRSLRLSSLGTLPVRTSASGPSVAANTKGSTSGGRTWSLKTVRPVGIGPDSAFFTSA